MSGKAEGQVEQVARAICIARGRDPDYAPMMTIRVLVDGRLSDTGHNRRIYENEERRAPPAWRDYTLDARAALSRLQEPDREWRPIESAPKDGTSVIIAVHNGDTWLVGEAHFRADEGRDGSWWWANESPSDYHAESIDTRQGPPAFWQPLPASPSPSPDTGQE